MTGRATRVGDARAATARSRALVATVAGLLLVAACTSAGGKSAASSSRTSSTSGTPGGSAAGAGRSATGAPRPSKGCNARTAVPHGISDHSIVSLGVQRVYQVDVPASYDGTKPYAIVFGLHALSVDYRFIPSMTGFDMGERFHFIGVNPSGRLAGTSPYWNAAPTADNDDVTFLAQLLDRLEATLCVDTSQVFSTGMSNGAQMSSLLACRLSDRVAAIAPVSGEEFLEPCTGTPVPILAFHGTADPILPYTGGGLNATQIADTFYFKGHPPAGLPKPLGIDESMRLWARHNRCDPQPTETRVAPHVVRRTWQHCAAATVLYVIEGGGHSWPGKPVPQFEKMFGPGTTEIDATALMFGFFFEHRTT